MPLPFWQLLHQPPNTLHDPHSHNKTTTPKYNNRTTTSYNTCMPETLSSNITHHPSPEPPGVAETSPRSVIHSRFSSVVLISTQTGTKFPVSSLLFLPGWWLSVSDLGFVTPVSRSALVVVSTVHLHSFPAGDASCSSALWHSAVAFSHGMRLRVESTTKRTHPPVILRWCTDVLNAVGGQARGLSGSGAGPVL